MPLSFVQTAKHKIHYVVAGNGEPIVLVHGYPENLSTWSKVMPLLSKNFRVYALDLVGMGKSETTNADFSAKSMAASLNDFLVALDIQKAHVVGHDVGMAPVIALALDYPERVKSIVIGDGNFYTDTRVSWEITWLRNPFWGWLLTSGPKAVGLWWTYLRGGHKPDSAVYASILEDSKKTTFSRNGTKIFQDYARAMAPLIDRLGEIKMPVQIFWGEDDQFLPVENALRLAADIPGSRLDLIPGAGHFVTHSHPEELAALILAQAPIK